MLHALGKLPRRHDPNAQTYRAMLGTAPLPAPPPSADWSHAIATWPQLGNDQFGDCAWAAILHAVQLWTANAGTEIVPDTTAALDDYSRETGFSAGPPVENDNGTVLLDALNYWMKTGLAISETAPLDRLDGFAVIEPNDLDGIKRAVAEFGCCYVGIELPQSAEDETNAGQVWSDTTGTPIEGHCVLLVAYDADGMTCVTWGQLQKLTWDWWAMYGSEAYALLRREWIEKSGISPSGETMAQLDALIQRMHGMLGLGAAA